MTNSRDVSESLKMINNAYPNVSELVLEWINNDIVKKKLAQSYDDWMHDLSDHGVNLSLSEHIINYINNYYEFGEKIFQY
jgi:predicted naringenin-chalcone synthase